MAEEIIYDQIEQGDPDPLGLRKKAAGQKTKSDPLGLRRTATQPTIPQQPAETASFAPSPNWLDLTPKGYQPIMKEAVVDNTHFKNTNEAAERVSKSLETIDPHIKNLLYSTKKELQGRIKSQELAVNPTEAAALNPQAAVLESRMRVEPSVLPVEIEDYKSEMSGNANMVRAALEQQVKDLTTADPEKAKQLKADIYRLDAQDRPDKENKISKNVEKLKSGEYDYDIKRGGLVKPEGFFKSLVTGFQHKNQMFKDYEFYTTTDNEAAIIKELNAKIKDIDPDVPIPIPEGALGEAGAMLGGQPIKPIVGGAISGILTTPVGGAVGGGAIASHEMYKIGYASSLPTNYAAIKREHPDMPDYEAYQQAKSLAEKQAIADAVSGAAMGAIGAKMGMKPTGVSAAFQKSIASGLRQIGKAGIEKGVEGLVTGGAGAAGQVVKNIMAQKAGLPVDTGEGITEQLVAGIGMTMGMALAMKFGKILKPSTYNKILHEVSKMPDEVINQEVATLQESGYATTEEVQNIQNEIKSQRQINGSIKGEMPESDRIRVQEKIKKVNELEAELETAHKAYHPEIKEKIKKINEEIADISKGADRGELQKIVAKADIEGATAEVLKNASEKELQRYFKGIADQANDPKTESLTIETFGDEIVNKAKELYPAGTPIESRISVIQPGEIKQPETITISPREQPSNVPSTEKVSVIMPKTKEDAVRQQITNEMDVRQQAGDGEALVTRDIQPEITSREEGQQRPTEEAGATPSQEGQVSEPEMIGITHAQMDKVSRELGLPEYTKDPETFEGWTREAKDRLAKDTDSINKLINRLRNGDIPDPVETQMMKMHFAALKDRYNKNPTPELLNEINRTKDLYNIAGREEGKRLVARRGLIPEEDTLADFHLRDVEFNKGARLTEEQLAKSTEEYNKIKAVKDALEERVVKAEADAARLKAEKKIQQEAKAAKKDAKKDYKAERTQIIKDIAEKWKKSSKESLGASIVPFAKELAAIAPDVMKLVRNVVEEGIIELGGVIKSVHAQVKDVLPGISEKNIHDIIAGEYTKKQTRSQLAATLYELKKEAQLMNELDQLLSGTPPTNQKKLRQRNQKIEALRQQIKELKDDMGLNERTMEEKLASLKGRYKTKIKELEKKIADGDYGPDEKPEPIILDKEGEALRDEYLRLKEEREIRLLEQEYASRGTAEKIGTEISRAIKTGRTLQSSFDVSYPFRQTIVGLSRQLFALPFKKRSGKWEYTAFEQQKQLKDQFAKMYQSFGSERMFRRIMDDIHKNPDYEKWQKAGLDLAEPVSALETAKEEMFQSSYAEKIPGVKMGVKASHRAATTIANKMKWDIVNQLAEQFQDKGKTFENSPELYEATAKYANQLVGRGVLGQKMENAAPVIAHFVYSLRLYASRLQLLTYLANPRFYTKVPKEIRVEYLKDMTKFIALGGTVMGLAAAGGLKVGLNPFASDFGSIVAGDTRHDIWGGFKQYAVLLSRFFAGKTMSTSGEVKDLRPLFTEEEGSRNEKSRGDIVLRFLRTKASPELAAAINISTGKDFMGKPVTAGSAAVDYFMPLIYKDVQEAWKSGGVDNALLNFLLASHGVGVQTYGADEKKPSTRGSRASKRGKNTKATKQSKN